MLFLFAILLLLAAAAVPGAVGTATCYNNQGRVMDDWFPCSSNVLSPVPCCGRADYCLSNGLCLDAGANNLFTEQGCTDKNWGAPCAWHCPGVSGNYSQLWLCSNHGGNAYCCDSFSGTSCCDMDPSSLFTLDYFTAIVAATAAASAAPVAATTAVATTTATAKTTITATTTNTTTTTATVTMASATVTLTPTATGCDTTRYTKLGVGVGVGLPVGVVCTAAALAAGFHWGRRRGATRNADDAHQLVVLTSKPTARELPGYSPASVHGVFPPHELPS